jgi:Flp pilus assembly protein TadG
MLKSFWRNEHGNFAMIFAIAVVPVMTGVLAMLDYTYENNLGRKLYGLRDEAAQSVANKYILGEKNKKKLQKIAENIIIANLGEKYAEALKVDLILPDRKNGGTISVNAKLEYKPILTPVYALVAGVDQRDYVHIVE